MPGTLASCPVGHAYTPHSWCRAPLDPRPTSLRLRQLLPTGGSSAFKALSPKSSRPVPQEAWQGPPVQGSRLGTQPSGRSADLAPELWTAGFPQGHGAPCLRGQAFRIPSMREPMATSLSLCLCTKHAGPVPSAFSSLSEPRKQVWREPIRGPATHSVLGKSLCPGPLVPGDTIGLT